MSLGLQRVENGAKKLKRAKFFRSLRSPAHINFEVGAKFQICCNWYAFRKVVFWLTKRSKCITVMPKTDFVRTNSTLDGCMFSGLSQNFSLRNLMWIMSEMVVNPLKHILDYTVLQIYTSKIVSGRKQVILPNLHLLITNLKSVFLYHVTFFRKSTF